MKKLKLITSKNLLTLCLMSLIWLLPGCQQEEVIPDANGIDPTVDLDQVTSDFVPFIADERALATIATFNEVNGEFGESFVNDHSGNVITLNDLSDYDSQKAGFIHFDIDKLKINQTVFNDIREWATQNDACLIFESGSKNHEAMKNFYTTLFSGDANIDYDVKGLIIENSSKSNITKTTLISDKVSVAVDGVINTFFNGLKNSSRIMATRVNPSTSVSYPDRKTTCMRGKCTTTNGTPVYTVTNGFRGVPNNSSSYEYRASNVSYGSMGANIADWGIQDREVLKYGSVIHDAGRGNGVISCNQTANYSQSESFSKSWSIGIKLDAKTEKIGSALKNFIKELTFGASGSIGGSTSSGTTEGSSLKMTKQFARFVVEASRWRANKGYWTGNVNYELQRKPKSGLRRVWRTYEKVRSNFNGYSFDNDWDGNQPYSPNNNSQTQILFTWQEWGSSCNSNARIDSKSSNQWWN